MVNKVYFLKAIREQHSVDDVTNEQIKRVIGVDRQAAIYHLFLELFTT